MTDLRIDPERALDLLDRSIEAGATICTIGALTNLARLEERSPGRLRSAARIVTMGGWVDLFASDMPRWGPERDVNVQVDVAASQWLAAVEWTDAYARPA